MCKACEKNSIALQKASKLYRDDHVFHMPLQSSCASITCLDYIKLIKLRDLDRFFCRK